MVFQVSPGVNFTEIDLTTGVPGLATTTGALAGPFRWGPLNDPVFVDHEDRLTENFFKPDNTNAETFFTAKNFLDYGSSLWVVRVARETGNTALNATSGGTGLLIKNDDHYDTSYSGGEATQGTYGDFAAKHPGSLGNSLRVATVESANAYSSSLTGNTYITANTTTLSGTGTLFDTELTVGDFVVLNGYYMQVSAVSSNTAATLGSVYKGSSITDGATAGVTPTRYWEFYNYVDRAPGTSEYASGVGGSLDEMHVVVIDEDGELSGTANTVLERFEGLSKASDAKREDGSTNYYVDRITNESKYIRWLNHRSGGTSYGSSATGTTFGVSSTPQSLSLSAGANGGPSSGSATEANIISEADAIRGYNLFRNAEEIDVGIIMQGKARGTDGNNTGLAQHIIDNILPERLDAVLCLSPDYADVVNNSGSEVDDTITFRNQLNNSSYWFMDTGYKRQYDKYNDILRWVPLNGDIAGTIARTELLRDAWWSNAGYERGLIKNVVKLSYNPRKSQRDLLYKADINPVVSFPGQGTLLYGDKTGLGKQSAFSRINVRRLFIILEKSISIAARQLLFEFNDEFTRARFLNLVEPYLRDVQGRRGIYNFRVVCD